MPTAPARRAVVATGTAAVVVAAGAGAVAALAARQISHSSATADQRAAALAAGQKIALDFSAYDYRHIAADFKRVADESTGQFHKNYLTQSASVADLIVKARSVSTAEIASAGVVDATPAQATVVVALNRRITNTSVPNGQNDSFGVQIVLLHEHGRWLASKVTPL